MTNWNRVLTQVFCVCLGVAWPYYLAGSEYPASLGGAFDSIKLRHIPRQCALGTQVKAPSVEVIGQLNKVENWGRIVSQLNFSVPGAVYLNSANELARFAFRARDTFQTSTYVMKHYVRVERVLLSGVSVAAEAVKLDHDAFYEECGNKYVSVIEHGGVLHVGMKFSFASTRDKESFEANGAIRSVAGLKTHVASLSRETRRRSSVEIFFHQEGGDINALNTMFDSEDIVACSLDNFTKCQKLIENLWDYSTNQFSKSVLGGKYQLIGFNATEYNGRPKRYPPVDVVRERNRLLDALESHVYDRDVFAALESGGRAAEGCSVRCVAQLSSNISYNIRLLKDSVSLSFSDAEHFLKTSKLDDLELYHYHIPKLIPEGRARRRAANRWLSRAKVGAVLIAVVALPAVLSGQLPSLR